MSGKLILLSDGGKEDIYEPVNNTIHVGSDETTNVCLSGLKPLAFAINIDTFGRVAIRPFMKRLTINGKRFPKNVTRPLMNNSSINIMDYNFRWEYNPKFSKSYSMSPCGKQNISHDIETTTRNRKTMSCFTAKVNDENVTTTVADEVEGNIQQPEKTPAKKIATLHVKEATSIKKRASLLPVKENRTSELRRASIIKGVGVSDGTKSLQYVTPKKPIPSATMVKSVNAIMRTELRGKDGLNGSSRIAKRNTLGASTIFPGIIEKMDLFNVVTDEMKTVGPSEYLSNKFAATNSPKRTPRKMLQNKKRLSLRSELSEMGLFKQMPEVAASSKVHDQGDTVLTVASPTRDVNTLESENDEVQSTTVATVAAMDVDVSESENEEVESTTQQQPADVLKSENESEQKSKTAVPSVPPIEIINETMECFYVSDDDDDESNLDNRDDKNIAVVETVKHVSTEGSYDDSSSFDSVISVDDDDDDDFYCSERSGQLEQTVSSLTATSSNVETDGDVDSPIYEVLSSTATTDTTPESNSEKLPKVEIQETTNSSTEVVQTPSTFAYDTSSEVLMEGNASQVSSISTPTKRESLIRKRRNSRLCSLDECCSPAVIGTPTKNKLTNNVVSTPRSILKTPKATKTPKKNVRILETILHEEEDENSVNPIESTNFLDGTFDKESDNKINSSTNRSSQISPTEQPETNLIESNNEVLLPERSEETEKRTTINQIESTNAWLDVTFDKDCENEINSSNVSNKSLQISPTEQLVETVKIESNNEALLAGKGDETEKRSTINQIESSKSLLDVTFDKDCENEINSSNVSNKSLQISPTEHLVEIVKIETNNEVLMAGKGDETEKRSTINQIESSNSLLDVTFDKDCENEINNSLAANQSTKETRVSADAVEIDKNDDVFLPVEGVVSQQRSSVNPTDSSNLLNLTFDKESNDEVNKPQAASQSPGEATISAAERNEETPVQSSSINHVNNSNVANKSLQISPTIETLKIESSNEVMLPGKEDDTEKPRTINQIESSNSLLDVTFDKECENEVNNSLASEKSSSQCNQPIDEQIQERSDESSKFIAKSKESHAVDEPNCLDNELALVEKQEEVSKFTEINRFESVNLLDVTVDKELDLAENSPAMVGKTPTTSQSNEMPSSSTEQSELDTQEALDKTVIEKAIASAIETEPNNEMFVLKKENEMEGSINRANSSNLFDASLNTTYDNENNCAKENVTLASHSHETSNLVDEPAIEQTNVLIVNEVDLPKLTEKLIVASTVECDNEKNIQPNDNVSQSVQSHSDDEVVDSNEEVVDDKKKTKASDDLEFSNDENVSNNDSLLRGQDNDISDPSYSKKGDATNLMDSFDMEFENDVSSFGIGEKTEEFRKSHDKADDCKNSSSYMTGVKELLNTPKPHDKTNFVGMKELLNTPLNNTNQFEDLKGVKELLNTPKQLDKTNLLGMKELLTTPDDTDQLNDVKGVKELFKTPKALDKTYLVGLKELVSTPVQSDYHLMGVRELLTTPKPLGEINLDGVSEMLQTPHISSSDVKTDPLQNLKIDLNFKSRASLINKLNVCLSQVGVKVRETIPTAVSDDMSEKSNDPLESEPKNDSTDSGVSESEASKSKEDTESTVSIDNSKNITDEVTSNQKETVTDAKTSKTKNVAVPESSKSSEDKIVKDAVDTIKDEPASATRSRGRKPKIVNTSKGSSNKNSKISSIAEEETSNDELGNSTIKPHQKIATSDFKSEPTAVPLKGRRKQANSVNDSKASKVQELSSQKEVEASTSSESGGKNIDDEEITTNDEAKNSKMSPQNKTSSDGKSEVEYNPTPVTRKGRKKKVDDSEALKSQEPNIKEVSSSSQNNDEPKISEKKTLTRRGRVVKELESAETSTSANVPSSSKTPKRNKRTAKPNTADEIEEQVMPVATDDSTKHKKSVTNDSETATTSAGSKSEDSKTDNVLNVPTRRLRQKSAVQPVSERTTRRGARRGTSVTRNEIDLDCNVELVDVLAQAEQIVNSEPAKKKGRAAKVPTSSRESKQIISKDTSVDKTRKITGRPDSEIELVDALEPEEADEPQAKTKKRNVRAAKKSVTDLLEAKPTKRVVTRARSREPTNEAPGPIESDQSSTNVVPDETPLATSKKTRAPSKRRRGQSEMDPVDDPEPASKREHPKRNKGGDNNEDKSEQQQQHSTPVQPKRRGRKNPVPTTDVESDEIEEAPKKNAAKKNRSAATRSAATRPAATRSAATRSASNRGHDTSEVDSLEVEVEKASSSIGNSKHTKTNTLAIPIRKRLRSVNVTDDTTPSLKKRPKRGAK